MITSSEAISPVRFAVISATPPHTAEMTPDTDVRLWLEIDHSRSVQLLIFGRPGRVPDDQLPSNPDVEADELDAEPPLDAEPVLVLVVDEEVAEGPVGVNSSVVFLN